MSVNAETLNGMLRFFRDDSETIAMIVRSLESFESYHQAIYAAETTRRLFACGAMDADAYREQYQARDRTRTREHNGMISYVSFLNRLAAEAGLPPFYDGVVSEDRPYRRQVANAVLAFVGAVIDDRA